MGGKPISPKQLAIAGAFALSCFCLILLAWVEFGGTVPLQAHGYRFHVLVPQATNLATHEDVRIAGVTVGKVVTVTPDGNFTDALLELDPEYAPLSVNAKALLRSKTLLGENFVQLTPGNAGSPAIPDGGYMKIRNVDPTQAIDQLVGSFDQPTRIAFQNLFVHLGQGLHGQGESFNSAFGNADPALVSLNNVIQILSQENVDLTGFLHDTGTYMKAFSAQSSALQNLFTAGNATFAATNSRNAELTQTFQQFPAFLTELKAALAVTQSTAAVAAPTLKSLVPVAPLFKPALEQANTLLPEATTGFKQLNSLVTATKKYLPAFTEFIKASAPVLGPADQVLRQFEPFLELFQQYDKDAVSFVANTGAAFQATSNGVHVPRTRVTLNQTLVFGQSTGDPNNRHNAYPAPGSLSQLATGLAALDCNNTSNPPSVVHDLGDTGTPPCIIQKGWTLQGLTREYPQVQPYTPSS